jgi:hypothetical protein
VHLVEEHLRVGVHGSATACEARVVGVWWRRRRWKWRRRTLHRMLQIAAKRIRTVACWELRRSRIEGIDPISQPGAVAIAQRFAEENAVEIGCL